MELRHSELGKKYMEWLKTGEPLELKHYGVRGQKWGVRRYQDQTGRNTELGLKRRRTGYDENEPKTLEELKKRDLEKGYVDEKGFGRCTENGHNFEKERRSKMSAEEQTAELKKFSKYVNDPNPNNETAYKTTKLLTEISDFVLNQQSGVGGLTKSTKKVYDTYIKAMESNQDKYGRKLSNGAQAEKFKEPYRQSIDSAVLKELGYTDSPEARKYIRDFWDYY